MKKPKQVKRYCPYCKKHTEHKVTLAKKRTPFSTHRLAFGSKPRVMARGRRRGAGNKGKYSRKPVASRKMSGKKHSKKTDFRYECSVCKKIHMQKKGKRAKKIEMV